MTLSEKRAQELEKENLHLRSSVLEARNKLQVVEMERKSLLENQSILESTK